MANTLDALISCNPVDPPSFFIYDTLNASQVLQYQCDPVSSFFDNASAGSGGGARWSADHPAVAAPGAGDVPQPPRGPPQAQAARRKRRRRPRTCKNPEDAENQRMTHIAVERNRRRQMNEYLAVLRSLMPDTYVQRGDQASIVAGAIDFVKELEQHLQSLEAHKRALLLKRQTGGADGQSPSGYGSGITTSAGDDAATAVSSPPFAQFFSYPQYNWCHAPPDGSFARGEVTQGGTGVADIEVSLIETHANLRILAPRRLGQLVKMVAGLQALRLAVLHLNVTTSDAMVLYSLSLKVEEGCTVTTVDDIAAAVHHLLSIIESETGDHLSVLQ